MVGLGWFGLSGGAPTAPGITSAEAASRPEATLEDYARDAALRRVRGNPDGPVVLNRRGPDEIAVCGEAEAQGGTAPFVVRVLFPPHRIEVPGRPPGGMMTVVEQAPGVGGVGGDPWARYCQGPAPIARVAMAAGAEAPFPMASEGGGPPRPLVTVRGPANLREAPGGGAAVLRVAKRGEVLSVHGQAPGGWLQVGDPAAPAGWIHASLLDRQSP